MHIFKVFADKGMQGCFSPFVFNVLFQTFLSWQEENYFPSGMLRSNEALKSIFFLKQLLPETLQGRIGLNVRYLPMLETVLDPAFMFAC